MRTIGEALFIFLLQMLLVVVVHAAEKPLIYWPMDEGAGEVICDTGSNGFVGELHDVTWVEGRYGKAVYFNGEGAYIDCGNSPQMDLKDCFTIDFWLRPDKQSGGNKRIISKGDKSTGNARGYQYLIFQGSAGTDTQNIHLYISNGKSITELSAPLQLGIWQHFVAVWDGINVSLFMNGRCFGRKPFTGPLNLSNSDINLLMGSLRGNDAFWRGALDEVKLYDSAISEVSITEDKVRLSREQIMLLEKTVSGMEADIKTLLKRKSSYSLYPRIYEYVMNMKRKLEVVKESNGQINLAEAGEWEKEIPAEWASLKKMVSYMAKNKS
ncbi:MAG: LamG domain-containing protein, partial [bacterium]|nr:LamG domain-containing protein [bacterium]